MEEGEGTTAEARLTQEEQRGYGQSGRSGSQRRSNKKDEVFFSELMGTLAPVVERRWGRSVKVCKEALGGVGRGWSLVLVTVCLSFDGGS